MAERVSRQCQPAQPKNPGSMRIDRYLWFARLCRTRALAQDLATSGRLRIDGRAVERAAAAVRVGATIAFATPGGCVRALRVTALPARRGPPAEGRACYADLLEMEPGPAPMIDEPTAPA